MNPRYSTRQEERQEILIKKWLMKGRGASPTYAPKKLKEKYR